MKDAIIGGTGVYGLPGLTEPREKTVETPYGSVDYLEGSWKGREVLFLSRHGRGHGTPPHAINYRGLLWALKEAGVERVLATAAVGSLHEAWKPGDLVILRDFLDFTKNRPLTFYEGEAGVAHVSMADPYCATLRSVLAEGLKEGGLPLRGEGVYVCTEGPRFETAAEIRMYRQLGGDVVGMTNVPEVVLAKELGLCYAAVGIITNFCTGMAAAEAGEEEIRQAVASRKAALEALFLEIFSRELPRDACGCQSALMRL